MVGHNTALGGDDSVQKKKTGGRWSWKEPYKSSGPVSHFQLYRQEHFKDLKIPASQSCLRTTSGLYMGALTPAQLVFLSCS